MVITLTYLLAWITLMQGHALPHKHHSMQGARKFFVTSDNAPPSYRTGCANCDKNAHCVKANCVCKRDYVGNGLVCDRDDHGYHHDEYAGHSNEYAGHHDGYAGHHIEFAGHRIGADGGHHHDAYAGHMSEYDMRRHNYGRSACLPNPCHNGGSCHIFDDDEARCVCTNDRNGKYCDMEKEIMHAIEGPNHHADGTPSHEFAMHPHNISLNSHEEDDYYHPHEEYHGEHHGEVYNKGHEDHIPSFHHDEGYHEGHSPMPVADSWHEGHDEHVSMPIHHDEGYHDGHMEGFHGDLDHTAPMPIYHEGGDSYHDGGHYGHMPIHHEESYHHDGGEHMEHSSPHHQTYQDELHIDREGFPVHHEEEFHHDGGDDHVYHEHEHEHEHFHDLACHSDPCWNGATCIDEYHGGFKCICRTGWRGPLCEEQEESDPCRPNPCKQGETCIDYGQSFRCKPAKEEENKKPFQGGPDERY